MTYHQPHDPIVRCENCPPSRESVTPFVADFPKTFESTFRRIFDEAFNLLVARQRKYGPENVRQLGIFGVFERLADDKVERIRRALNGRLVHGKIELDDMADFADESFEDALLDIANYALILIALKRGVWGAPLEGEQ